MGKQGLKYISQVGGVAEPSEKESAKSSYY